MIDWIIANEEARGIQVVLHVGDVTRFNEESEWLRLVEFLPDGTSVAMKTYSPYLDRWWREVRTVQVSPL